MLDRFLLAHAEASEWPGTRLMGHAALVREYTFDDDLPEALVALAPRLYAWQQPDMLEDARAAGRSPSLAYHYRSRR